MNRATVNKIFQKHPVYVKADLPLKVTCGMDIIM